MSEVRKALERIGLGEYADVFIAEGFDTWDILVEITESDLTDLNVKLGHRRKLQRAIADSRQPSTDSSPHPNDKTSDLRGHGAFPVTASAEPGQIVRTKRKYKRHPKPDVNAPERPASAYVLFSNHMREVLKEHELSFTEMAKIVGERWQVLPAGEREKYESQASAAKEKYAAEMAEYKKTEHYQQYQKYLIEFKATHSNLGTGVEKRPKLENEGSTDAASSPDGGGRPRTNSNVLLPPHQHSRLRSPDYASKSTSPTASVFSAAAAVASPAAGSGSPATDSTRLPPVDVPRYAPHNAHTLHRDRRYTKPEAPQYGAPLTRSSLMQATGDRPAPLLTSNSSSSMSTVPSLSKESSTWSQDSSSPGTPFQAMMQEGAPRSARVLPTPGLVPAQGTSSGSFVLDHRPLPPKPSPSYNPEEDPRNSVPLAALLRAGELAREADSSNPPAAP